MKPRTKLQRRVVAASGRLPEITPAQLHWGYAHLLPHEAFRTKKGKITCTECRHTWLGDQQIDRAVCPHCGVRLTVVTTRRRTSWNKTYLSVVTTREGLQVIRYFLLERRVRDGHPARYKCCEVMQRWIAPDGKYATVARMRNMSWYYDVWRYATPLELRSEYWLYNRMSVERSYPRRRLIPECEGRAFATTFMRRILSVSSAIPSVSATRKRCLKSGATTCSATSAEREGVGSKITGLRSASACATATASMMRLRGATISTCWAGWARTYITRTTSVRRISGRRTTAAMRFWPASRPRSSRTPACGIPRIRGTVPEGQGQVPRHRFFGRRDRSSGAAKRSGIYRGGQGYAPLRRAVSRQERFTHPLGPHRGPEGGNGGGFAVAVAGRAVTRSVQQEHGVS